MNESFDIAKELSELLFLDDCLNSAESIDARREYRGKTTTQRDAIIAAFDAQAERIAELEAACRDARSAIESLPTDSLGVAYRVECAPDGEGGVMTWPIRDELVDKLNRALDPHLQEATDESES